MTALRRALLSVCIAALACAAAGCLGYRTTGLSSSIASVAVRPFTNVTGEPDLDTAMTTATVREFQKDGSLRVMNADEADALLEVTITSLALEPLRYSPDRATETTEFRLVLSADITLKDRKSGKTITACKQLTGRTTFTPEGDLSGAKRRAIPPAAQDLAHQVVAAVVEAW